MARTPYRMKGMSFREGQSPIRNMKEEAFRASEPGSSKEELIEAAKQFTQPIESLDLDYGGYFEADINVNTSSDTGKKKGKKKKKYDPKGKHKMDPKQLKDRPIVTKKPKTEGKEIKGLKIKKNPYTI